MSGGFAMVALRTRRTTFVVLVLVAAAGFFAVGSFASRALTQSEADAQATAKALASAGVASVLEPEDVTGRIEGETADDLLDRLQRGVLADGTVFRIRVWSPEGGLLFSTDAADQEDALGDLPSIGSATKAQGRVVSRVVDGEVFETFVPLRLGETNALGAVQIDQGYTPIAEKAASPWELLRTISIAVGGVCLLLVIVATLPIGVARNGGFTSSKASKRVRPSKGAKRAATGQASPREVAKAQARAERAEAAREEMQAQLGQLRAQIASSDENSGQRIHELEIQLQEALEREERSRVREAAAVHAPSADPAADDRSRQQQEELHVLRERAEAAESRVRDLETSVRELEQEPHDASGSVDPAELESLRAELAAEKARADQGARLADTADQTLLGYEARVQELEGAVATARSQAAEASAKLEASQSEVEAQVEAASARADQAEARASEALERAERTDSADANASTLIAQLEGQLMEERGRIAELQTSLEQAGSRTEGAQGPGEETGKRATDRDVEMAAAQIRASEAERASRAAEDRAEAADERAARLQARVDELATEATETDRTLQELEARATRAEERAESIGADLAASGTRLGESDARIEQLEKELSLSISRAERADELTGSLEEASTRAGELEGLAREATEQVAQLEAELTEEREARAASEEAVAKASTEHDAVIEQLDAARAETGSLQEALEAAHLAQEGSDAELERVREEARLALDQVRADANTAEEAVRAQAETYLESAVEQATEQARLREAELAAEHETTIRAMAEQADARVTQAKEEAAVEVHALVEQARTESRSRLSSLEGELADADARAALLETQLAEQRVEIESSHAATGEVEARAAEAVALADQAREDLNDALASVQASRDVEAELTSRIEDLELRAAEATASAQAFKAQAEESRSVVETVQADAAAAVEKAEAEANAAVEKARREAVEAVRRKTETTDAVEPVDGERPVPTWQGQGEETEALRSTVADLEGQLEQMSERLRHAYAQAESVQAALSSARNSGELPPVDAEVRSLTQEVERLRTQLGTSMAAVAESKERADRAEADLLATQGGVTLELERPEPGYEPPPEPAMRERDPGPTSDASRDDVIEEEESEKAKPELSLRSRLANTAARKKQRGRGDDASGF